MRTPIYIRYIKHLCICYGFLFTFLLPVHARQVRDTGNVTEDSVSMSPLVLYFRFDKALVDSGYMANGRTLRHLHELFTDPSLAARIDSVSILSFASPEGGSAYNEWLARFRASAVKDYLIRKYPHLNQYRIHPCPQGENWQELRRLIAGDNNVPHRAEVLHIIDLHQNSGRCKELLQQLGGGASYRYIRTHLLRYLRNAAVCVVRMRPDSLPMPAMTFITDLERVGAEVKSTIPTCPQDIPTATSCRRRPLFALKTNLLFDAALMPNVEIEIPIGKRWSINGEYMFPWWQFDNDKYCMQVLMGGLEGRY